MELSLSIRRLLNQIHENPIIKGSIRSLIGNGVGHLGSFVVSIMIASLFGATIYTDAFFIVFSIIAFFATIFRGALDLSFIPAYAEVRNKGLSETRKFLGSMILNILWVTLGIIILIDILVWIWADLLFKHPAQELLSTTIRLTWEMSPAIIGVGGSALFIALFNAEKMFMEAGLVPLFPSLGIILFAFFFKDKWDVHALSLGLLLGTLFQIGIVYLYSLKKGFRFNWTFYHPHLSKTLRMASFQTFAIFLASLIPVIDRVIVSFYLPAGNVTAVENASRLCFILWALGNVGYINVFFSLWSQKSSEGEIPYLKASFRKLMILSCFVFIPASIIIFSFSLPIVKLAFGYGKYTDTAILATSEVFGYYMLGYWAFMLRSTFIRFYSARQRTSLIVHSAILDFSVHFVALYLLIQRVGIGVIGIATTIGYIVSLGYLVICYFKKEWHSFNNWRED